MQFAGGLYTDGDRRVYFDGSDPTKPLMRVPQQGEPEGIVSSSYSWDRGDPLHMGTHANKIYVQEGFAVSLHTN